MEQPTSMDSLPRGKLEGFPPDPGSTPTDGTSDHFGLRRSRFG
jgi:hypothetical protein